MSRPLKIAIEWTVEDILSIRPTLSIEEASTVLNYLEENHDANIGINWDVIEAACDYVSTKYNHMAG